MTFDVLTLFPEMFEGFKTSSIIGRAIKNNLIEVNTHLLRNWAWNNYGAVDDRPYGGGPGMVIRADVIDRALSDLKREGAKVILTSAKGKTWSQAKAEKMMKEERIIIIAGHYEGVDQRVADKLVDEEISIGNYVLTGGELAAMVMVDSVSRLIPGVLGKDDSSRDESFSTQNDGGKVKRMKEYPQYTRPAQYFGIKVPEELLSGDPKIIEAWKLKNRR
ncbi:MAG: tRNA (guanosine(37)-N1)-methyltransferase TrmD [Candidatus Shapirobacteria bacterium]